jgi:hypothetical protein
VAKVGLSSNANTRSATAVGGPVVLVAVWSPNDANARHRPNEMADTQRPGSGNADATAASGTAKTMADFGWSGSPDTCNATTVRGSVAFIVANSPDDANAKHRPDEMADTKRPGSGETDAGATSDTAKTVAESLRSAGPKASGAEHHPMADTNQPGGPGAGTKHCATATMADLARAGRLNTGASSAAAAIDRSHTMAHPGQGTSPGTYAATTDTPDASAGR